jgi:branched-chain amino acid transport system permease protein
MSTFGTVIITTLVLGSLYALLGVGTVVLFRSTGVINFALGVFVVLGAYLFYYFHAKVGLHMVISIALVLASMSLAGALIYFGIFRRLVGTETFVLVIGTLGLAVVIQTVVILIAGPAIITPPVALSLAPVGIWHGLGISPFQIFVILASAVVIISLQLMLRRTKLGTRMRAVADNTLLAGFSKVRVHQMSALAWAICALCAAVAGICLSMQVSLDPIGLQNIGLIAFAGVLLGGVDSIEGAAIGGLILALVQQLSVQWLGGTWSDPIAFMVLLVVLLLRPQGLFGSKSIFRL